LKLETIIFTVSIAFSCVSWFWIGYILGWDSGWKKHKKSTLEALKKEKEEG